MSNSFQCTLEHALANSSIVRLNNIDNNRSMELFSNNFNTETKLTALVFEWPNSLISGDTVVLYVDVKQHIIVNDGRCTVIDSEGKEQHLYLLKTHPLNSDDLVFFMEV